MYPGGEELTLQGAGKSWVGVLPSSDLGLLGRDKGADVGKGEGGGGISLSSPPPPFLSSVLVLATHASVKECLNVGLNDQCLIHSCLLRQLNSMI